MVDELSTRGPDPPFREAVLPWGARRRPELLQAEVLDAAIERGAEDPIAVADQAPERSVGANGFHDLLRRPLRRRVLGDVDVDHAPTLQRENEEHVEHTERHGWHGEEVDRDQLVRSLFEAVAPNGERCA